MSRAVRLDGHLAEDIFTRVFGGNTEVRLIHVRLDFGGDRHQSELLDRPSGHSFQPAIDVLHQANPLGSQTPIGLGRHRG